MNLLSELPGISAVEALINDKFASDAKLLSEIPAYLFSLGGKKIRPNLALLTAYACGLKTATQPLIQISAGIELIHMATLLHDDIIDNSALRRNKESAHKKFGLPSTLLAGDFLLVRAFGLCGQLDEEIVNATEAACVHLTEGEILETPLCEQTHTLESSIEIARKKTAALFKLATFCGSFLAGAPMPAVKAFADFGENLGIAFQMLDDILDITSTESKLGKPIGTDIREKKPSLINVLWISNPDSRLASKICDDSFQVDLNFINQAKIELENIGVISSAKEIARNYCNKAKQSLQIAKANSISKSEEKYLKLEQLTDYVIERSS